MSLDHGMLNVPLAKRGNIDAQIDTHKAAQKSAAVAQRRAAAAANRDMKALAKSALLAIFAAPGLIEQKAAKLGHTSAELKAALTSWSKWEPAKLVRLYAEWFQNTAAAPAKQG